MYFLKLPRSSKIKERNGDLSCSVAGHILSKTELGPILKDTLCDYQYWQDMQKGTMNGTHGSGNQRLSK